MHTNAELGIPSGTPDKKIYCSDEKNVITINEKFASNLLILCLRRTKLF